MIVGDDWFENQRNCLEDFNKLTGTAGWTRTTDVLIHSLKVLMTPVYCSSDSGGVSSGRSGPTPSSRTSHSSNSEIVISPGAVSSITSTVTVSTVRCFAALPASLFSGQLSSLQCDWA